MRTPQRLHSSFVLFIFLATLLTLVTNSRGAMPDGAAMQRGVEMRKVLNDFMDRAFESGGDWPQPTDLLAPAQHDLVYLRPASLKDTRFPQELGKATVVIHERFDRYPQGIWVGYADGHLEYAESRDALRECQSQLPIVNAAIAAYGNPVDGEERISADSKKGTGSPAEKRPGVKPAGTLRLRVVDGEGRPVQGVLIGRTGNSETKSHPRIESHFITAKIVDLSLRMPAGWRPSRLNRCSLQSSTRRRRKWPALYISCRKRSGWRHYRNFRPRSSSQAQFKTFIFNHFVRLVAK